MREGLVIGDVAGQYDALMRLVGSVDSSMRIYGVGDLVDRGPNSCGVVEWFMSNERADSVMGNHEHMMIDFYRKTGIYRNGIWIMNGGGKTRTSYEDYPNEVPEEHIRWLESRKPYLWLDEKKCLVTHAPLHPMYELETALWDLDPDHPEFELSLLWNRKEPRKRDYFQIFGHNAHWGLKPFGYSFMEPAYALCIDQSWKEVLTGFHWPTGEIFEEPYEIKKNTLAGLPTADLD